MVVIEIPKRHATEVIEWLHANVSANQPYSMPADEWTPGSTLNPNWISTVAQIARWRGEQDLWQVEQRGNKRLIQISCQDPRLETFIVTRWGQ